MHFRGFVAAIAAVVLFTAVVDSAQAYPVAARRTTTTVTGVYNPLDLNLSLVNGTNALQYNSGTGAFRFSATLGGTYAGVGYAASGQAGTWEIAFGNSGVPSFSNDIATNNSVDTITLSTNDANMPVGRLRYVGGGDFSSLFAHPEDTPAVNDQFFFYADVAAAFLQVTCHDGLTNCDVFDAELSSLNNLRLLGPFTPATDFGYPEEGRTNTACLVKNEQGEIIRDVNGLAITKPCGSVQFSASSVPEPASLALVGLGLVAIALGRRRHRPRLL